MRFGFHLLSIFFLSTGFKTFAQADNSEKRTFYGGISAGANFSALIGDVYGGYHKAGINAGGIVYARFSSVAGASMEFLYSQKGCRGLREIYSMYVGNMLEKYSVDLNYVEIPVQFILLYDARLNFGGGISYSRLISSREKIETDQPYNIEQYVQYFDRNDWAFLVSCNLRLHKNWIGSLRYQQSFKPIRDPFYVPLNLGTGKQYNSYFTLKLVYLF